LYTWQILLNYRKLYINKTYKYSHQETYIIKLETIFASSFYFLHVFSLTFSEMCSTNSWMLSSRGCLRMSPHVLFTGTVLCKYTLQVLPGLTYQLPFVFLSMIRSCPYLTCMQTVGQNENNKQKLTPNEIRPDREESPGKIPFLRVGSWLGWLLCCM
jgi:hypothetical protein